MSLWLRGCQASSPACLFLLPHLPVTCSAEHMSWPQRERLERLGAWVSSVGLGAAAPASQGAITVLYPSCRPSRKDALTLSCALAPTDSRSGGFQWSSVCRAPMRTLLFAVKGTQ